VDVDLQTVIADFALLLAVRSDAAEPASPTGTHVTFLVAAVVKPNACPATAVAAAMPMAVRDHAPTSITELFAA